MVAIIKRIELNFTTKSDYFVVKTWKKNFTPLEQSAFGWRSPWRHPVKSYIGLQPILEVSRQRLRKEMLPEVRKTGPSGPSMRTDCERPWPLRWVNISWNYFITQFHILFLASEYVVNTFTLIQCKSRDLKFVPEWESNAILSFTEDDELRYQCKSYYMCTAPAVKFFEIFTSVGWRVGEWTQLIKEVLTF